MSSFSRTSTGKEVVSAFEDQVRGKTIIITGASKGGLGAETALSLATANPAQIILAGRTESKITPVIEQIASVNPAIRAQFVKLDLTDQKSIKKTADEILGLVDKVDILLNNAGIMAVENFETTKDGIESHFGANHIGHFLLTNLLLGKLAKGGRVVNVTSMGYEASGIRWDDWNFQDGKTYNPWLAYGQSKTANVLFAASLAEKLEKRGARAYVIHPGFITSSSLMDNVPEKLLMEGFAMATEANGGVPVEMEEPKSLQQGCATSLVAALDPSIEESSGSFLRDCRLMTSPVKPWAQGKENADRLWKLSEELVGGKFQSSVLN